MRPNPCKVKTRKNKMRWQPSGNGIIDIGCRWQTRKERLEILCVVQIHAAIIYELCGAGKEEYDRKGVSRVLLCKEHCVERFLQWAGIYKA